MSQIRSIHLTVLLSVLLTTGTIHGVTPYLFSNFNEPYTENFNSYHGTADTLPAHMSVSWDKRIDEPFQGINTGAFTAYTSDDNDFSFGIRERNPVDLRDARLFFHFTNDTGAPITGFNVSYDVETWFVGNRRNRIRLKYDNLLSDPDRATFETDIFSTDNPSDILTVDTTVDGSLSTNRTTVSGFVDLTMLDDGSGTVFGPLQPGETAYFRWQFSNTDNDEGSLRSGLAINNLEISAIPEPSTYAAIFGALALMGALLRRRFRS